MALHPEAQKFLDLTSTAPDLDSRSPTENRRAHEATQHLMGEKHPVAYVEDAQLGGVNVRIYVPEDALELSPVFIFFHGGGWVLGDLDGSDSTMRDITRAAGVIGISVDYRRAPEHPFPIPLNDCKAVVEAVLSGDLGVWKTRIDRTKIAVGGDSAGGNMAAVIAQEMREDITHQVLIYPVMAVSSFDTSSHEKFAEGYFLSHKRLDYFYKAYLGEHGLYDPKNIRISPGMNPDLDKLPSATVLSAECDPLVDETEEYAQAMLAAGNKVSTIRFQGQVHPFVQMAGIIGDALVARRIIGQELRVHLRDTSQE